MKPFYLVITLVLAAGTLLDAHDGKKHHKDSVTQDSTAKVSSSSHDDQHKADTHQKLTAGLGDFPSVHPLIVHFAIVMIILAAVLQVVNFVIIKREFAWIITGLIVVGFSMAVLASTRFHPHTRELSLHAKAVLKMHDAYADWTLYFAGVAGGLQIFSLFFFKTKRWALGIVTIVMIGASYCIIHAGHYGAQLVHIEGVGPQGKFLDSHHAH